jgi:hypothetical protein
MAMRGIGAFIGLILVLSALPASAAEFVVVAGGAPGLMPGQVVQSGATLEIPAGASVTLVSESGKTLTLKGPYSGPAGTGAAGGGNPGPGLIKALSGLLTVSGRETASLGAMRGVQPSPPPDPWVVDIARSGDHCVPAKDPVRLWRAKKDKARILFLKNLGDKSKSVTDWPAGSSALAWPAEVTLGDGGRYLLGLKGSQARRFNLHLVPAGLPTDAHRAAWMAKKGCVIQAKQLLTKLR